MVMPPKTGQGAPGANGDGGGDGSSPVNTARLDNYVPTFNNVYWEFRKRAEISKKKMDLGNRGSEVVFTTW